MVLVMLLAVSAASVDHNDAFGKWRLPRRNVHFKKLPFKFFFFSPLSSFNVLFGADRKVKENPLFKMF